MRRWVSSAREVGVLSVEADVSSVEAGVISVGVGAISVEEVFNHGVLGVNLSMC